jgi:hypothetical protein
VEGATAQKANDRVTMARVLPANTGCIGAACPIRKELGKRQGYTRKCKRGGLRRSNECHNSSIAMAPDASGFEQL